MTTIEKILKVLEAKGITPTKAERLIGVSQGVLTKAIERKGSVHEATQEKFLRYFHVKHSWWETEKGDIFEENLTSGIKSPPDDLRDLVENWKEMYKECRADLTTAKAKIVELERQLEECRSNARRK